MKRIIILTLLTSTVWSQSVPELGLNEILEATRKKNLTMKSRLILQHWPMLVCYLAWI